MYQELALAFLRLQHSPLSKGFLGLDILDFDILGFDMLFDFDILFDQTLLVDIKGLGTDVCLADFGRVCAILSANFTPHYFICFILACVCWMVS